MKSSRVIQRTPPIGVDHSRITFASGQKLTARDLQAVSDGESRLRGLHVRAVHATWGVALGYQLMLSDQHNKVRLWPGLAYDCHGGEILLSRVITIDPPADAPGIAQGRLVYDLLLSAAGAHSAPDLAAGCPAEAPIPRLRWSLAGGYSDRRLALAEDVRLGEEIPLGRFTWHAELRQLELVDLRVRRNAQALTRPHIAFGFAVPVWNTQSTPPAAWIDTRAGGFQQTPFYFAGLSTGPGSTPLAPPANGLFLSLRGMSSAGFTAQLLSGPGAPPSLRIFWMGIESNSRQQPLITLDSDADWSGQWSQALMMMKMLNWITP